jgi:hypothetical protein
MTSIVIGVLSTCRTQHFSLVFSRRHSITRSRITRICFPRECPFPPRVLPSTTRAIAIPRFPSLAYLLRPSQHDYRPSSPLLCQASDDATVALSSCISFISSWGCVHNSRPRRGKATLIANQFDDPTFMIPRNSCGSCN